MALTKQRIAEIIGSELTLSEGDLHSELEEVREKALIYFKNERKGDELTGRSQLQSGDFADMVEAIMAEIIPIYSSQSTVQFEPTSEEDDEPAKLESQVVEHMIERHNGYTVLSEAVKDALMMRNGFIKVYVDEKENVRRVPFEGLTDQDLVATTQQLLREYDDVDVVNVTREEDVVSGTLVITRIDRELVIRSVPPENIRYSTDHESQHLDGIRFFAERQALSRSELIHIGLPKKQVDDMSSASTQHDGAQQERQADSTTAHQTAAQRANDLIETYDVYIEIDEAENGKASLKRYLYIPGSQNKIFNPEDVDFIPYVTGSPFIFPHRVTGWSIFDKTKHIEDAKRKLIRNMMDNVQQTVHGRRRARTGAVDPKSLLESSVNSVIWCDDPTSDVVDDLRQSILADGVGMLNYLDKMRTEKSGAALDMINPEFQLAGKNAGDQGIMRQLDQKEKMVAMIGNNLGNSLLKGLHMLVHRVMRTYLPGNLTVKLSGKFQQTDPSEWPERKHCTVQIGMSGAQRMQRLQALDTVMINQTGILETGRDHMVSDKNIYNAQIDYMQATNLPFPEQYLTDPESEEGQQMQQARQQQQAEQAEQQQALQQGLIDIQNALEKYKIDTQAKIDVFQEEVKIAIKEAELQAEIDIEHPANDRRPAEN